VRVERWVPQAAVMREAAAMVGHGGAGSVDGVVNDPRYRDRARRIADEIQALPPIDHAAPALEALVVGPASRRGRRS
jgi:UDP:flavonoid glycosyltransferase YjiC (YdhE family)